MTEPTMATVPPLSLSAVQRRYPRLFEQYTRLSDRESDAADDLSGPERPAAIDPDTGLRLVLAGNDFSAPLCTEAEDRGCPMKTDSDANRFATFLWKVLAATDSCGSVGDDDARLQHDALRAALDDAVALASANARFEHLLGWTAAAAHHRIDALLGPKGDPCRCRSLFGDAADAWRGLLEGGGAREGEGGEGDGLVAFARWQCGWFRKRLRRARGGGEECAGYAFDFEEKPRPGEAPVAAAVAPSSSTDIAVTKYSKESKLGIGLDMEGGKLKVKSIALNSAFVGKNLRVGMVIDRINGREFATGAEAAAFIGSIEGGVTFEVSTVPSPDAAAASGNDAFADQNENAAPANVPPGVFEAKGPWEEDGWVPTAKSGKQKSPNLIRGQLQKYIDQCKMDGTRKQMNIIEEMGVNSNTFRRFMNPGVCSSSFTCSTFLSEPTQTDLIVPFVFIRP